MITRLLNSGDPDDRAAGADYQSVRLQALDYYGQLCDLRKKNERLRDELSASRDYSIDLQRIIEDLCHDRDIREPKTTARYHYDMAVKFQTNDS